MHSCAAGCCQTSISWSPWATVSCLCQNLAQISSDWIWHQTPWKTRTVDEGEGTMKHSVCIINVQWCTVQSTYIDILYIDISLYRHIFKFLNESISYFCIKSIYHHFRIETWKFLPSVCRYKRFVLYSDLFNYCQYIGALD